MDSLEKIVAQRLRAVMREFTIAGQRELGEVCGGASPSQVGNWLNGYNLVRVPEASLLCKQTGITLDWLYRGELGGMDAKLGIRLAKWIAQRNA